MFSDEFIESLPEDRTKAAHRMCELFRENDDLNQQHDINDYESYIKALGQFQAFCETAGFTIKIPILRTSRVDNVESIRNFFNNIFTELDKQVANVILNTAKEQYLLKFGKIFCYEFTDGDLEKIQKSLDELRGMVVASSLFEGDHKARILSRLERLQAELHKRMSSLDRFWGLVGEAGVALGKFGTDSKPFVDRIKDIAEIIWRTQAKTEELPSDAPFPILEDKIDNPD